MKVYVVRHGQTELNKNGLINGHIDVELTPEGIEQAKAAAPYLPKTIKHIYSSSLKRAKQTAELLNVELRVPLTLHDELKEVNFGVLEGTPFLELYKKKHRTLNFDWRPSGESLDQVKERLLKILKQIKKERADGEALIVSHGGIIRLMQFFEFGQPLEDIANASLHGFDLDKVLAGHV